MIKVLKFVTWSHELVSLNDNEITSFYLYAVKVFNSEGKFTGIEGFLSDKKKPKTGQYMAIKPNFYWRQSSCVL